jgi:tetratricopeptide (TPR) repeat protein
MRILILVFTLVLIDTAPHSKAEDTKTWVGKKVVFKEPTHSPIVTRDRKGLESSPVFTVKRANRGLLFIFAGEAAFWVPSRELLLEEKASEYKAKLTDHPKDQIRLSPRDAQDYSRRGYFRLGMKDFDNAIADFNVVIRLTPKDARAYYGRALGWKRKRDFAKAIADFNDAIRLQPRFAEAYDERAWLWSTCTDAKFRDAPRAIESAHRACELTSESKKAKYLDTLAAAFAESGDFAAAVKTQAEANNLFAGDEQRKRGGARLILYQEKKPYRE